MTKAFPSAGFVRLSSILGLNRADSCIQEHMVGGRPVRPLPQAHQAEPPDHSLARRGHSHPH